MTGDEVVVRPVGEPGDLGWTLWRHAELYASEHGFGGQFERDVLRIAADWESSREDPRTAGWVAVRDGRRVGTVYAAPGEPAGEVVLRLLLVEPEAQGLRLGGRLVDALLQHAGQVGAPTVRLWTAAGLEAARVLYLSRGFRLVGEEPHGR